MLLHPTDTYLYFHMRHAHQKMLVWKAADQEGLPDVPISEYGCKIHDGITCPSTDIGSQGPPLLTNVITCRCRAKDNACKVGNCSCHCEKLSCTIYCLCIMLFWFIWMFTFGYISHRLVFLCLVKQTITKTIGCMFGCQLREMGKFSKCQQFWTTNDLDIDFIHWLWPLIMT